MSYLYGPKIIKDKILANISAAIREIHRLAVDDDNKPSRVITNDDWQVHCLLEHLDFALLYGLRLVQDGYYKCVCEFTPKLLLTEIESLLNIETNIGRGRAWLFFAFNDNLTESYIKCFQDNKKLIRKYYTSDSIVNDTQRLIALTTLCSGLENIKFDLKIDCVYFDRSCWPAYLQVDLRDTEKLNLPGVRNDVPTFATYLSRYDAQHIPSAPAIQQSISRTSKRVRVPKRTDRASTTSSVVNSLVSSDIQPVNLSRSSSVSFDNPSIDGLSFNDENQIAHSTLLTTASSSALESITPGLSSSLSELDPMLNNRPQTPSPMAPGIVDEQNMTVPSDDKTILTETNNSQSSLTGNSTSVEQIITTSEILEQSLNINDKLEQSILSSSSKSIDNELNELSVEKKPDNLLEPKQDDPLDLPADANLQLQFTLEVYGIESREDLIKLYPTTIGHNNGNVETVFCLISTKNVFLLRQTNVKNHSYRIEKIESVPLEQINYMEIGPNEQFFRIITTRNSKLNTLTTGCAELTRAICGSIIEATQIGRFPIPKTLPATMQELSIKKMLAKDLKRDSTNDVELLDYHYTFWEEPQMSGRKLRKEGQLMVKLVEPTLAMRRIGGSTLMSHQHPFEAWRHAYVTLRVDRLNIFLNKSDKIPALSYTLLDENCQGCRRNRNSERAHAVEIMFVNDVVLKMAAKSKTEQDEWLNAIMKGLSQGRMAVKDEEISANTVPCSVMLTDEKIYVCHDEKDNALIRQLDSVKLEYIVQLLVDPECQYYCVLSMEHGSQGSKSWIFYFLFVKEMIQFVKTLQGTLSKIFQVSMDIHPLTDPSFQRDCEQTAKRLLRSNRPLSLIP